MDSDASLPGTPTGGPLQVITQERVNQQRDSLTSVHDKISQFNNMSIAMQSKQLERKTADAALKRAMLGREEAELEVRKYKDELKSLRKAVEEGKERERRVGERLETVMENYGRAKETHAHTQALWEKEIRRARKETFKTQSTNVKLQEEIKTTRTAVKILEENLEREKERCAAREQEAFEARYQIVGVQEQLDEALARIKIVEQERDAFKTAAKNEEVARIAAEGRIPLPIPEDPQDEFASPPKKKTQKKRKISSKQEPRYSLSTFEIDSSVAAELEIEELTDRVQWEKQRADRAMERLEFLEAELEMKSYSHTKTYTQSVSRTSQPQVEAVVSPLEEPSTTPEVEEISIEEIVEREELEQDQGEVVAEAEGQIVVERSSTPTDEEMVDEAPSPVRVELHPELQLAPPVSKKGPRLSTIFCPREGTFRTVSEQEAEILEAQREAEIVVHDAPAVQEEQSDAPEEADIESTPERIYESASESEPVPAHDQEGEQDDDDAEFEAERTLRMYARTPSVDPPSFALLGQPRTSLLSLLNAPHGDTLEVPVPKIPMVPDTTHSDETAVEQPEEILEQQAPYEFESQESPEPRPHTSATLYTTVTTTTTVPVRDDNRASTASLSEKLRTPSDRSKASFDTTNPALTPTMTREQALAKIRERRGRARSAAAGAATPAKRMLQGTSRRDMSAPQARAAGRR